MHLISLCFFTLCTFGAIHSLKIGLNAPDFELANAENEKKYCKSDVAKDEATRLILARSQLWKDGIIPYQISPEFNATDKSMIEAAMFQFDQHTCIRFRPRKAEEDYIIITKDYSCNSDIGKMGKEQKVTLSIQKCFSRSLIMHYLMRTLGFAMEHMRPDRDDYVHVLWDNIEKDKQAHFCKVPEEYQISPDPYDYNSIMHFSKYTFSRDKTSPTIVSKTGAEIGPKNENFSESDIVKITKLYDCPNSPSSPMHAQPPKPTSHETDY